MGPPDWETSESVSLSNDIAYKRESRIVEPAKP